MPGPLHIQVVAPIKGDLHMAALQFIHNAAVVNAFDLHPLPLTLPEKPVSLLTQFRDANWIDAQHALGQEEVAERLLMQGIDLQKNHFRRIVAGTIASVSRAR